MPRRSSFRLLSQFDRRNCAVSIVFSTKEPALIQINCEQYKTSAATASAAQQVAQVKLANEERERLRAAYITLLDRSPA